MFIRTALLASLFVVFTQTTSGATHVPGAGPGTLSILGAAPIAAQSAVVRAIGRSAATDS